jgi:hypothetical protein
MSQAHKYQAQIASNPLLAGIPRPWSVDEWTYKLIQQAFGPDDYPLAREDHSLVDMLDSVFVPTQKLVDIAGAIHQLLWNSLVHRDPRYVRKDGTRLTVETGADAPYNIQLKPRGMLIQGITHLGKSTIVRRTLEQFPQVIEREEGWNGVKSVRQLVWLVVPSPLASSLAAFISALAEAIDRALGTNYQAQLRGRSASDDFTKVLSILRDHYCALLVIEEGQPENKLEGRGAASQAQGSSTKRQAASQTAPSLAKLFMDVMNAGIGVALVGNPLAFKKVLEKSQLLSRLADNCHDLHPALSHEQPEWKMDYLPGIWRVTCLPNEDEDNPGLAKKLWVKTGGFHHALIQLRKVALQHALEAGADRVRKEDADAALNHHLGEQTELFRVFAARDADRLRDLPDVPDEYAIHWRMLEAGERSRVSGTALDTGTEDSSSANAECEGSAPRSKSQPAAQPQKLPRARARRAPREEASPQDLRSPQALQQFRSLNEGGGLR